MTTLRDKQRVPHKSEFITKLLSVICGLRTIPTHL